MNIANAEMFYSLLGCGRRLVFFATTASLLHVTSLRRPNPSFSSSLTLIHTMLVGSTVFVRACVRVCVHASSLMRCCLVRLCSCVCPPMRACVCAPCMCVIQTSSVSDGSMIGMKAVVDGATVEEGSIVAAGAIVIPGTVVGAGQVRVFLCEGIRLSGIRRARLRSSHVFISCASGTNSRLFSPKKL